MSHSLSSDSVLFITLDSCRYDTFAQAMLPQMKALGPLHKAMAPSHFTFGSHAAMFAGFTPGIAGLQASLLNPKYGKLFKIVGAGFAGKGTEGFQLVGRSIIDGFKRLGYATIGSGSAGWFNSATETGKYLSQDFDHFFYPGDTYSLKRQLAWIDERLAETSDQPVFTFINVGETHVPYYFDGAPWAKEDNPCRPFQSEDRAADCRYRQQRCCEWVDQQLGPLLDRFAHATVIVCADHGDCWGEDGLWEHGISHEMTLTVPLIIRFRGQPVSNDLELASRAPLSAPARPTWLAGLQRIFLSR